MAATDVEYIRYVLTKVPPWLRREHGSAFLQSFAQELDLLADEHLAAAKAPWPWEAPTDALAYIGSERQLERYTGETDEDFRVRLWDAWETWFLSGTEDGLLNQLYLATNYLGLTNISIRTNADWNPTPPDGNTGWWSRFWVVIGEPHPWTVHLWGQGSWGDGRDWGGSVTPDVINLLRRVIKKWKPSHAYCEAILIQFGSYEISYPVRA